jgi:hypothetical protein
MPFMNKLSLNMHGVLQKRQVLGEKTRKLNDKLDTEFNKIIMEYLNQEGMKLVLENKRKKKETFF